MTALDALPRCRDIATLRPVLHKLCEQFGRVTRLDVLTSLYEGTRQAICFLRLESPEKEQALMQTFGVGRFGGEIVFVVDLDKALSQDQEDQEGQEGHEVFSLSPRWAAIDESRHTARPDL